MNSGEARIIREVAQSAKGQTPKIIDDMFRARGVFAEVADLKAGNVDPLTFDVVAEDMEGNSIKEGDIVTMTLKVGCVHEVMDQQTGKVKGHFLSLAFVHDNKFVEHLGNFDSSKVTKLAVPVKK